MKILAAQLNYIVGDLEGNYLKIKEVMEKNGAYYDLIVFSELSLTGYPPLDLVERAGFCKEQMEYLGRLALLTYHMKAAVIVGHIMENDGVGKPFFNCASLLGNGEIARTYKKRLLPTYNIFDESRHFEPGKETCTFQIGETVVGLLICEDMWNDKAITNKFLYPVNPVEETVKAGAELIVSVNASPSNVGKPEYRLEKFAAISKEHGVPILYVNQVGGNDDIVFDGTSFAVNPDGHGKVVMDSFTEETKAIWWDDENGGLFDPHYSGGNIALKSENEAKRKRPEAAFYFRQIVLGIRDYVRKCGFKKVAIASSGGIDSALVLALAVEAVGSENVIAITMPSAISSKGSVTDSQKLCENLGVKLYEYPIREGFDTLMEGFDAAFGKSQKSLTKENLQARIRGMILMAFTNENPEYLPLTTGNKSECAVGYCTIYGDMNGGLAPISDLYKTEVWELCRYINDAKWREVIPNAIIDKEPSAELYEGQKDSDSLPPYPVLDAILIPYIEGTEIDPKILAKCKETVEKAGFKDFAKIHRMVDRAEFKRRQAAPTIRVHQKAWGAGRRLPIVQKHSPANVLA
jgi:NAD+ synthetase